MIRDFSKTKQIIGVTSIGALADLPKLKQILLYFDRITFSQDWFIQAFLRSTGLPENVSTVEWLIDQELVFEYELPKSDERLNNDPEYQLYTKLIEHLDSVMEKSMELPKDMIRFRDECFTRLKSLQIRRLEQRDAFPVFYNSGYSLSIPNSKKAEIIHLVLNFLPMPDDSTSWEQIIDYRNDPNSKGNFLALKNWINEVATSKLSPAEIQDKLEFLIYEYQRHMKVHKLKASTGTFETIVVTSAEILEDLVKVQWSKLANALFSFKRRKIELLEAELNTVGAEIAYIVKAEEKFGS